MMEYISMGSWGQVNGGESPLPSYIIKQAFTPHPLQNSDIVFTSSFFLFIRAKSRYLPFVMGFKINFGRPIFWSKHL